MCYLATPLLSGPVFFSSLFLPFSLKNAVQACGEELQHLICCESHPRWLCLLMRTGLGRAAQRQALSHLAFTYSIVLGERSSSCRQNT